MACSHKQTAAQTEGEQLLLKHLGLIEWQGGEAAHQSVDSRAQWQGAHQSVDSREEEEEQAIQGQGADSLVRGRVGLEGLQTNKQHAAVTLPPLRSHPQV